MTMLLKLNQLLLFLQSCLLNFLIYFLVLNISRLALHPDKILPVGIIRLAK